MSFDPVLAFVGLVVGTLVGISGMGGAALMAPVLIALGFRPLAVVGTDLAYSTITKLIGSTQHIRFGKVDFSTVRRLALGSVPGSVVGIVILRLIDLGDVDRFITRLLGTTLLFVAIVMVLRVAFPNVRPFDMPTWGLPVVGFVVGVLVGITSVGSGSLIVAVLASTTKLSARTIVGTDIVHAFLLVFIATIGHWGSGNIDFALSANLLIGAIPGVLMGSRLSGRLSERIIRPTIAVILFATGLRMI